MTGRPDLGPVALADAQRILDRAAARLLRARLDRDAVGTASGRDDGPVDDGADQVAPLVEGEDVPVVSRQVTAGNTAACSSSSRSRAASLASLSVASRSRAASTSSRPEKARTAASSSLLGAFCVRSASAMPVV